MLQKRHLNMNYKISFQELAEAQKAVLSKQQPVSLEQARKQVEKPRKN